jgi:hypothetical protein
LALSALLDANVLHPHILCDLLLRLAEHDVFRPLWSAEILAETIESVLRRRPDLDRARLQRRLDAMNPPHVARRFDIAVRTADDFLTEIWGRDPRLVAGVVVEQSRATRRPHLEPRQLLQTLGRAAPQFARLVAASPVLDEESDAGTDL